LVIAIVTIIAVLFAMTYYNTSKNYYINYTENGNVDYKVYYHEDENFVGEDAIRGPGDSYIAENINKIVADFEYELHMEEAVNYSYSYKVNARLEVYDRSTGKVIYHPTYELVPEKVVDIAGAKQSLEITESAEIDYAVYNNAAHSFINKYRLDNVRAMVVIEMEIEVLSNCESFEAENTRNSYVVSLNVPLNTAKVNVNMTSTVPAAETKILACTQNANKVLFLVLTIIAFVIDALLIAFLVAFIFLTRNTDINYSIKVGRIVSNYKSYIQQIVNPFNDEGYQILMVNEFVEMLEIRDTLQSPILMNENEDKTCTRFIIPTNTKVLYVYEVKVDDYDEIYAAEAEADALAITGELPEMPEVVEETPAELEMEEETVILMEEMQDEAMAEAVAEAVATRSWSLSEIDFEAVEDEEVEDGVEVVGVVWPEREKKNKVYRYDPNGEKVTQGDIVLVPSRDEAQSRDIVRKATVAYGNHKVDPEALKHPLKKIIGIVKRKAEAALMPKAEAEEAETTEE
jgi:hypothetical protein